MKICLSVILSLSALLLAGAKFVPGVSGQALESRFRSVTDLTSFTPEKGSAVFWFKTAAKPADLKGSIVMCFGINRPGWCYFRFDRGYFGVFLRNSKEHTAVSCSAAGLEAGKWHHAAVVWGKRKHGFVRIYLNGKLCAYQRIVMPEKFSSDTLAIGYNSSNWKAPAFPGAVDELALFDVPLSEEMIRKAYEAGKSAKALPELPGRLLYFPFDGSTDAVKGTPAAPEEAKQLLRTAYRKAKIKKYDDEIDFRYSYSVPTKEKSPEILSDGNDNTGAVWRQIKVAVTGEFDRTQEVTEIEIVTRKYTKWYLLKQLQVSWDDGSGNFSDPVVVNTYAYGKKISKKNIDETCKVYVYSVKNPGKICRFRIALVGDGYFGINEIRIRAKK